MIQRPRPTGYNPPPITPEGLKLLRSLRSSRALVIVGLIVMLALFGLDRASWTNAAVPLLIIFLPLLIVRHARRSLEDLFGKRR